MYDITNLDLLSVAIVIASTCVIGFSVYFSNRASVTNRYFLAFSLITAAWGTVNYMAYHTADPILILWFLRLILFFAVWQAFFLFELFYAFPNATMPYNRSHRFLLIPLVIATALITLSPLTFTYLVQVDVGSVSDPNRGAGLIAFGFVAVSLVVASVYLLIQKLRRSSGLERQGYWFLLGGVTVSFCLIIAFNFLVPVLTHDLTLIPLGALFMFPLIACTAYAIVRDRIFNVKVAATALLVFALAVFTFADSIFAESLSILLFRVGIFVLVLVFGINLIKSVIREVEQREEIERLSNEKSEFMSFASHEIRNPITAMRGYASLLSDGTLGEVSDKVKDVAYKILVNGDTVLSLISEFLNKSKLELGQISYNIADVDIGKTISSIGEGFKAHAAEKGLAFDVKIEYPNLIARADEPKLREVVGNLIDNSIKYTKTGGVTVAVEKHNGMARVVVSDTGVGIPPETIANLFQKFSRADAQKMNLLGTGLGLYLAKNFIEGMGGRIWAESDGPGKGSRFIIELHTV